MHEAIVEVHIPGELLQFGIHTQAIQQHLVEWLVLSLFKDERVSSGKAAKLLGISRMEFLDLLRRRGIAYLDYSPDEIAEEIEATQRLEIELQP